MTETPSPAALSAPPLSPANEALLASFREGKPLALARLISVVENERDGFQALLHRLLRQDSSGGARVGITGPPGAGKSSLVTALASTCRGRDEEVGIVAVDPTSPYSGGALLGDRIRMNELATDPGVFIRSMASRGSLGGLATTSREVVDVMDAFGFHRILIETVGVGQTELEVAGSADTVVVVLVPESGDGIQAMKAGLMEIADIFVVNKADRPGAHRLARELESALHYRTGKGAGTVPAHHGVDLSATGKDSEPARDEAVPDEGDGPEDWTPPVLLTMAQTGEGVDELLEAVARHRSWLAESGALEERRRARTADRIRDVLDRELKRRVRRALAEVDLLEDALDRIRRDTATPYSVAAEYLARMGIDPAEHTSLPQTSPS
ncbi:MAG: methylmalonyl Co-A mutase-associated GTPase MeaB [Gemmatimonadales bacterium]|nr:MAG: methylmalonyl Co-A mutase-associated GTPase MeaB [Gemmatimonadales bacterium]